MTSLATVLLETETALPMDVVGWTVLIVSLLIAAVWFVYLYR